MLVTFLLLLLFAWHCQSVPVQPYKMVTLKTPPQINPYDSFGTSVSIKDNAIAVGADVGGISSQGVVHTFKMEGGEWEHDMEFIAADGENGDRYGNSVVVFDEFLFVGAFLQDRSGKVYVYRNNAPHFELTPLVRVRDGYFGHVVKAKNYTLAVGHPSAKVEHEHESGNVVIYNNWGLNWVMSNYITPAVPELRTLHGFSLDFDRGDEVIVGAPKEAGGGRGYIYGYVGHNVDNITEQGRWDLVHSESGGVGSELGQSVVISGNHSAMSSKQGGPINSGYVITLKKNENGGWVKGQTLTGDSVGQQTYFGNSMVMKNDILAVGSPFEGATGAVYIFHWWDNVGEWRFHYKLMGPEPEHNDWYHSMFGWSLDLNNDILIVGSPGAKTLDGTERAGSVFVFSDFQFERPASPTNHPTSSPTTGTPTVFVPPTTVSPSTTPSPTSSPTTVNTPSVGVPSGGTHFRVVPYMTTFVVLLMSS